jgi:hypothetical protein
MKQFDWKNYRANVHLHASRIQGISRTINNNSGELLPRSFYEQELQYTKEYVQLLEEQLPQAKLYYTDLQQCVSVEESNLLKDVESDTINPVLRSK